MHFFALGRGNNLLVVGVTHVMSIDCLFAHQNNIIKHDDDDKDDNDDDNGGLDNNNG